MKIKGIVLGLMIACAAGTVVAQENDDMYFNSKDRAKLNAKKAKEVTTATPSNETASAEEVDNSDEFTPTESYSTRNTNPEYTSRSNSEIAQTDNEDYFVSDYRDNNAQSLNRFNNNYSNWYNNSWYSNGYFASSMYGYNSPYYNGYCSPWNSGFNSGWYGSVGYSWGSPYYGGYWGSGYSPWDYGYGSYGYGYPYVSYYGSSWAYYGGGWNNYYNNWGGNNVIIIDNGSSRGVAYSKRPTRGGMLNTESAGNRTRSQIISRGDANSGGRDANSGGRVATSTSGRTQQQTAGRQEEYYNRSWRRTSESSSGSGSAYTSPTRSTNTRSSDWNNGGNRSSTYQPSRSSSSYEPSRSSGSFNTGGGSRSGGGSSSGSSTSGGSGGRTRSH
jgi:hypothetical protein